MNSDLIPTPRRMDIAITGRCNLRCQYCYYADEMVARTDLSTIQWLTFFKEMGELGIMNVCLTGGEIFTRSDIFELIDGVIANRMRYQLLTNATLITDNVIDKFKEGKRRNRLDNIQISIDGSRSEIHNLSRPNSFERSMRGLRLLKDAGFPITVRVTVNRHNLYDLENIFRFLLEDVGVRRVSSNEAEPVGAGCRNVSDIGLTPTEQIVAMQTFSRLLQKYPGRITATSGPQAKIFSHAEMEHAKATGEKSTRWEMGSLTGCGCVYSSISVMHDGAITPCLLLYKVILGNITKDSLGTIWRDDSILNALRERRDIKMQDVPGCETCEWSEYCNGNCPAMAHHLTGDFNRADPSDCYRQFLLDTRMNDIIKG